MEYIVAKSLLYTYMEYVVGSTQLYIYIYMMLFSFIWEKEQKIDQ